MERFSFEGAAVEGAPKLASVLFSHMRTDFTLLDAPKYIRLLSGLDVNDIAYHTLPGEADDIDGETYFFYDADRTRELVSGIFTYADESVTPGGAENGEVSGGAPSAAFDIKKLRIRILNGGDTTGAAEDKSKILNQRGFNVINVGVYDGVKQIKTRFIVRADGDYGLLAGYFKSPLIEVDAAAAGVYDVVIITGLNEDGP